MNMFVAMTRRWHLLVVGFVLVVGLSLVALPSRNEHARDYIRGLIPAGTKSSLQRVQSVHEDAALHFIVPATSSNKHFCRLMLSSAILNYPPPIFINWGAHEDSNAYVQHLAKVEGILKYLGSIPADRDNDLVLVIDGYDIFLQLRPDTVIKRYYQTMQEQNEAIEARFGKEKMQELGVYQSVLFGPDKICWPEDPRRYACWAVPNSTLPEYAFGPDTDGGAWRHLNRPRWLNSGTIMGPIKDVRAVLTATLEDITLHHTTDSDQFYFANVWGKQEYVRTVQAEGPLKSTTRYSPVLDGYNGDSHIERIQLHLPELEPNEVTEYHITIDYKSTLFQTMSYYNQYLGWVVHNQTSAVYDNSYKPQTVGRPLEMPDDILDSPAPFPETMPNRPSLGWADLALGRNFASGEIFGLLHFTPPKWTRDHYWPRMWYYPYGEAMIRSAHLVPNTSYVTTEDGKTWWPYQAGSKDNAAPEDRAGGGFSGELDWLSWNTICGEYEEGVFVNYTRPALPPTPPAQGPEASSGPDADAEVDAELEAADDDLPAEDDDVSADVDDVSVEDEAVSEAPEEDDDVPADEAADEVATEDESDEVDQANDTPVAEEETGDEPIDNDENADDQVSTEEVSDEDTEDVDDIPTLEELEDGISEETVTTTRR